MSTNYLAAEVAWREAWWLAEESKAVPMGTKAREAADAAFSRALGQALAALDHLLATLRARLTDACIATVAHVAELQSAALTLAEDSPERDQANADAIAAYVELGRSSQQCSPVWSLTPPAWCISGSNSERAWVSRASRMADTARVHRNTHLPMLGYAAARGLPALLGQVYCF